ncbi:MAG: protein kinase [Planctomycetota bacterium]
MQVGRYTLGEELARGGMGAVHRARGPDGEEVALKLLLELGDDEELARFLREAQAAQRISHPGVVRVREVGHHGARPFLVMDLVRGESLQDRLKRAGPLPEAEAVRLVATVARAVAAAHAVGVLHRDLKPANVLLDASGQALLTDFGVARLHGSHLTRTGEVLGTPAYMAPEQASGERGAVSAATDVYGLGGTLYAALCGRPPFAGGDLLGLLAKVLHEQPEPLRAHRSGLDPQLEAICLRCLERDPSARYPDALAVAEALEAWSPASARETRLPRLAGGLVGLLGTTLALAILAAWGRRPRSPARDDAAPQASASPRASEAASAAAQLTSRSRASLGALRLVEAEEDLRAALRLEPDLGEALAERGWLAALRGEHEPAAADLARGGASPRVDYLRGRALFERVRWTGDERWFGPASAALAAAARAEGSVERWAWVGLVELSRGDATAAARSLAAADAAPGPPCAAQELLRGGLERSRGEARPALATLRGGLRRFPEDPWLSDALAMLLLEIAQRQAPSAALTSVNEALVRLRGGLRRLPGDALLHAHAAQAELRVVELGRRGARLGDGDHLELARQHAQAAYSAAPQLAPARAALLSALRALGRFAEAYAIARAAHQRDPEREELRTELAGFTHMWAADAVERFAPAEALPALAETLAVLGERAGRVQRAALLGLQARALGQARDWHASGRTFARALELAGGEVPWLHLFRARTLLERVSFDPRARATARQAVEVAQRAASTDEERALALAMRAELGGRSEASRLDAEQALRLSDQPRVRVLTAYALGGTSLEVAERSVAALRAACGEAPRDPYLRARLARTLVDLADERRSQEQAREANEALASLLAELGDHPIAWLEHATALAGQLRRCPRAHPTFQVLAQELRRSLTRSIELEPENAVALLMRGDLLAQLGEREQALADLRAARPYYGGAQPRLNELLHQLEGR